MGVLATLRFVADHPLNRGGRIAALSRFARLQLAGRLIRRPFALPFVGETNLFVQNGMTGVTGNWYCGLHEPDEMSFVLHALRPGDIFLDVGANAGSYTVLAAGAARARTIAIEPLPRTFARLQANVRLNDLEDMVEAHCCGLSASPGKLQFSSEHDTGNRVAIPGETRATVSVPVRTLDEVCGDRRPRVIKIDVEGHELSVLEGGAGTLSSPEVEAVLMETNMSGKLYGVDDGALFATMRDYGFWPFHYDHGTRELLAYREGQPNTVFARDGDRMTSICKAAPKFKLVNGSI